jgi:hypothetical protein
VRVKLAVSPVGGYVPLKRRGTRSSSAPGLERAIRANPLKSSLDQEPVFVFGSQRIMDATTKVVMSGSRRSSITKWIIAWEGDERGNVAPVGVALHSACGKGRLRDGVHQVDVSDLMRRMVKEGLLKFDGKPLFPERIAYTVPYKLSDDPEAEKHRVTRIGITGVKGIPL